MQISAYREKLNHRQIVSKIANQIVKNDAPKG